MASAPFSPSKPASSRGQSQKFYKLEVQKSPLSRSNRFEPAIWVPVATAKARGIRAPMTLADLDQAFEIFASREHYLASE